ncbi:hypothetical protein GWK36_11410 [Caldichromatium japonicum]|uniref:Uncharacterized protein n=1 Tax=Caldichromatium japonicum TaxID=2699430 RepID=A0A6G7VF15_9GAMM|nr:hypothetical protein [Caldichromatium japonicum]QIK38490.1 hypothetical protein GWK36_11410 [Caldichromatium japonicum]
MSKIHWQSLWQRGLIWSLIGMIYALLFMALRVLIQGVGGIGWPDIPAGALAAGASAVLYGAHELALLSTGLGVAVGLGLLMSIPQITLAEILVAAALVAILVGLSFSFPQHCTRHIVGKLLAGLLLGGGGAALLIAAESLGLLPDSTLAQVMVLIGISGLLYVITIRGWVRLVQWLRLDALPCDPLEALVMAILAGIAAGSIWVLFVPILAPKTDTWSWISMVIYHQLPETLLGGFLGGALTGIALELLHLPWADDL